jgi:hypothetical protein
MISPTKSALVLFDEGHSEAWTIDPERASSMQPTHPEDSSMARAAELLRSRDFEVAGVGDGELSGRLSAGSPGVLVIAHPSDPKWEATTGLGEPRFLPEEIAAIREFVEAGGGLIVLGETEQDKYGSNVDELLEPYGIKIENATVQDYEHHHGETPSWVLAELDPGLRAGSDPLARVGEGRVCFYRAGALAINGGSGSGGNSAEGLMHASATASPAGASLAALGTHGSGRVVVLSDSDLFGDDCIDDLDHAKLWEDLVYWAGAGAFAATPEPPASEAAADPAWARIEGLVSEIRAVEEPDGSIDTSAHDAARLNQAVADLIAAIKALAPRFPHQAAYFEELYGDLRTWADHGFGKPDFMRSIEAFRPEQERRDGIEHLVIFPMYKQNASPDTCLEALIVRVPWPEWIAELERSYDNAKFLPVELVAYTEGYESECAVLFPETFAAKERPPSYFGGIFCDREAERLRRVAGSAASILHLNLPPDAAALLTSPQISQQAYMAWDLIHDRTHMRGDLPFDPFMIRQRSPYWMYALEELRCDLTTFGEAVKLEAEGFSLGRHVQYAILFDRLFRFPVTGSRVRNYDGLGGQLMFAFLHREGYLDWTDNELRIDWERVAEGVERLRVAVAELYRSGIDRSKLGQWIAAHDLVATYVAPAENSVWARERRELPEVEEPKQLVDLVRDDEFPLSLFYTQLQPKLEPALVRVTA